MKRLSRLGSPEMRLPPVLLLALLLVITAAGVWACSRDSDDGSLDPTIAKGIEETQELIDSYPDNVLYRVRLAGWYSEAKLYDDALRELNVALSLQPDYQEALVAKGRIYRFQGEYTKSLDPFLEVIDLNTGVDDQYAGFNKQYTDAYFYAGWSYLDLGRYDECIEHFEVYQEIARGAAAQSDVYYFLGTAYREKGDYDKALENFINAVKYDDEYAEAFQGLGLTQEALGDTDAAIQSYKNARSLDESPDKEVTAIALERLEALGEV